MNIEKNDLLVLVNGSRVIFFKNLGPPDTPNLEMVYSLACRSKRSSEIGRDRPGRSSNSAINGRAAFESVNHHQKAEENFIKTAYLAIKTYCKYPEFHRLIIVAEPRTMGYLRQLMDQDIAKKVKREIPKDLTKMPIYELEAAIHQLA